jgi:hypothetical protein
MANSNTHASTYNGWANKETWLVHLWLTNDQASDAAWRAVAAEVGEVAHFADVLRGALEDGVSDLQAAGLYPDLLTTALGRVDWVAVARHLLE